MILGAAGIMGSNCWTRSGGELASYPAIRNARSLAFSPDGSLLAAGIR